MRSPAPREGVVKDGAIRYRAAQHDDRDACILETCEVLSEYASHARLRGSVHEAAVRDKARAIAKHGGSTPSQCRERKKVEECFFAHLEAASSQTLADCACAAQPEPKMSSSLAATAQNLRETGGSFIPHPAPIFAT